MEVRELGNKIVIVGVSASGKTTFARKLQKITGLPLTIMDEYQWNPGWEVVSNEEIAKVLEQKSSKDEWIIEGYVTTQARTFLFERADTIVYLDYNRFLTTFRYVKRWWKHRKDPRPELPLCPEQFSFTFMKLVFTKGEAITLDRFLGEVQDQSKIIKLHSPKEAHNFLKQYGS